MNDTLTKPVPGYRIVRMIARLSSVHSPDLYDFVKDESKSTDFLNNLGEIKAQLALTGGHEVFGQTIAIDSRIVDAVRADPLLSAYWDESGGSSEAFSVQAMLADLNDYLLWLAIGLQYLNVRYGVEVETRAGRKYELGVGTSGVLFSVKDKFGRFARKINDSLELGDGDKANGDAQEIDIRAVTATDGIVPIGTALPYAITHSETKQIGGLFDVSPSAPIERIEFLAKLSSLYWEVNSPPTPGDGIPFEASDVWNKKTDRLPEDVRQNWPRGFRVSVGEHCGDNGESKPYVCVVSPVTIPGWTAKGLKNFDSSRAGRIARFIREYMGTSDVDIWFASANHSYNLQTGGDVFQNGRRTVEVRCLVFPSPNQEKWALFPAHLFFGSGHRGKAFEDVLSDAVKADVSTEIRSSGQAYSHVVGRVRFAFATNDLELRSPVDGRSGIDAAFAILDSQLSTVGMGAYQSLAPSIGVIYGGDMREFLDRFVVTLDRSGNARFGQVKRINAATSLEVASGHLFRLTKTLGIRSIGHQPFAEPGMSGSLVFLLGQNMAAKQPIKGEISLIGYIVGGTKNKSISESGSGIRVLQSNDPESVYCNVQPLKVVWDVFSSNYMRTLNSSERTQHE